MKDADYTFTSRTKLHTAVFRLDGPYSSIEIDHALVTGPSLEELWDACRIQLVNLKLTKNSSPGLIRRQNEAKAAIEYTLENLQK